MTPSPDPWNQPPLFGDNTPRVRLSGAAYLRAIGLLPRDSCPPIEGWVYDHAGAMYLTMSPTRRDTSYTLWPSGTNPWNRSFSIEFATQGWDTISCRVLCVATIPARYCDSPLQCTIVTGGFLGTYLEDQPSVVVDHLYYGCKVNHPPSIGAIRERPKIREWYGPGWSGFEALFDLPVFEYDPTSPIHWEYGDEWLPSMPGWPQNVVQKDTALWVYTGYEITISGETSYSVVNGQLSADIHYRYGPYSPENDI